MRFFVLLLDPQWTAVVTAVAVVDAAAVDAAVVDAAVVDAAVAAVGWLFRGRA